MKKAKTATSHRSSNSVLPSCIFCRTNGQARRKRCCKLSQEFKDSAGFHDTKNSLLVTNLDVILSFPAAAVQDDWPDDITHAPFKLKFQCQIGAWSPDPPSRSDRRYAIWLTGISLQVNISNLSPRRSPSLLPENQENDSEEWIVQEMVSGKIGGRAVLQRKSQQTKTVKVKKQLIQKHRTDRGAFYTVQQGGMVSSTPGIDTKTPFLGVSDADYCPTESQPLPEFALRVYAFESDINVVPERRAKNSRFAALAEKMISANYRRRVPDYVWDKLRTTNFTLATASHTGSYRLP